MVIKKKKKVVKAKVVRNKTKISKKTTKTQKRSSKPKKAVKKNKTSNTSRKKIIKKITKKRTVKRTRKVQPTEDQLFYMGIPNPIEVRRNILESARDMVHFLQLFERFRLIREEKKLASKLLRRHVKELTTLVNKLKAVLPKTSIRAKSKKEEMERIETPGKIKVIKEPETSEIPDLSIDDIEALETELKAIEGKLNFL